MTTRANADFSRVLLKQPHYNERHEKGATTTLEPRETELPTLAFCSPQHARAECLWREEPRAVPSVEIRSGGMRR